MSSPVLIAPSILAADFVRLADETRLWNEPGGSAYIDVMDGHFVLNSRSVPGRRVDHEMLGAARCASDVTNADTFIPEFVAAGLIITVHVACPHPSNTNRSGARRQQA